MSADLEGADAAPGAAALMAGGIEGQGEKVEDVVCLAGQVIDDMFVADAPDETGQDFVPTGHESNMAAAAVAGGSEAAGEFPVLTERLSESAEAAGHGVAVGTDGPGIGQDQANGADMEEAAGYSGSASGISGHGQAAAETDHAVLAAASFHGGGPVAVQADRSFVCRCRE